MDGFTTALDTADIDNDGDVDLMFADIFVYDPDSTSTIEDLYRLLINDGEGNFTRSTSRFIPHEDTGLTEISFVDVTGDEVPELIIGGSGDGRTETQLFFNDGQGNYDSANYQVLPPVHNGQGELMELTCAVEGLDFNGDGDKDLVLVRSHLANLDEYSERAVQLLQNDGLASFIDVTNTLAPAIAFTRPEDPPCWMSVVDLNLDGLDDLIFHFSGQDGIDASTPDWIWIQREQGGFDELDPNHIPVHGQTYPLDFDSDGDTDLVVRSYARKLVPFEGNFAWINDYVWSVLENTTIGPSSGLNIPLLLELLNAKEE